MASYTVLGFIAIALFLSSSSFVHGLSPVTTKSGLQYTDLVVGDGRKPGKKDFIAVHYEGKIKKTGEVFGSTRGPKRTASKMNQSKDSNDQKDSNIGDIMTNSETTPR